MNDSKIALNKPTESKDPCFSSSCGGEPRITRRNVLRMIGVGAAASALAVGVPVFAGPFTYSAASNHLVACRPEENGTQSLKGQTFAKSNLHVWAYEEYDAVDRTPEERAQVLVDLGITKAGYISRNEKRVSEFEAYLNAYREAGIELVGVWTPIHTDAPLEEVQVREFFEVVDRYGLKIQWWLTLEQDFDAMPEADRVDDALARLRPLVEEANRRNCLLVLYGHGPDRWFAQAENSIEIVERLKSELPSAELGIIYNFHQSHAQMDRLQTVMPQLQPHLVALNLNGMRSDHTKIERIGQGDREREMIKIICESGWQGPTGIIAHDKHQDAAMVFQENMEGLKTILIELGYHDVAATY